MKERYRFALVFATLFIVSIILMDTACKKKMFTQEEALERIQSLPEVQEYTIKLREKNSRPLIRQESSNHQSSIVEFSVGESHPTHMILWNRFLIDRANGKVFIFDIESGDFIPIQQWRKKE